MSSQNDVLTYLKTIPSGITFIHGKAGCGKTYLIKKLVSTYQVDDYSKILETVKNKNFIQEGYRFTLNAINEIYTDVVKHPQKQYQTENRTISVKLI